VRTLDEVLSSSLAQPRFGMVLLAAFAGLALGLAMVGIYGVIAYSVSQRTGEIGVRLALGAQAGQVVALVVRQGFVAALAGAAAGTLAAVYLSELLAGLLYGVTAQDPITFATVPALLLAVALIACWLPAARATRVRPASALRHE
jgi:putative ABC transport system permease protein